MCQFFSFLTNGKGKYFYLNAEQRQEAWGQKENPDSHAYIVNYFQNKGRIAMGNDVEDKFNKYEYTITSKGFEFVKDQINTKDDSVEAETWVKNLFDKVDLNLFDSRAAYCYCRDVKDHPEVRKFIKI